MKTKLLLLLILSYGCVAWGQAPVAGPKISRQEIIIKKQMIVDDLESRINDTPLAAVRVFARYKITQVAS
jgi:hypothetical protein